MPADRRIIPGLVVALLVAGLTSLMVGKVHVSPADWFSGDVQSLIIAELRLPRLVLGLMIGASLGLAGAVMQGYLRNPLADPGLFGVSSSAALGAVSSLYFGAAASALLLPAFALMGAALGMGALALIVGRSDSLILFTLAGLLLSSLTGALTTLLISVAPTPFVTAEIVNWLIGALVDRSWNDVRIAAPLILTGALILATTVPALDALTLGETAARSLGVDLRALLWRVVLGVGLLVGASVAVAGVIGFVGLIVPNLVRPLVGNRPGAVLLPAALAGALLVIVADSLVRVLPTVSELRLGVAMSLVGAPFFLMLLARIRRQLI
ncbi:FecCD family ABC transporter permease [Thermaurantiacus sp.]